jgi:DNA-binding NarL/FixJ family response regulator
MVARNRRRSLNIRRNRDLRASSSDEPAGYSADQIDSHERFEAAVEILTHMENRVLTLVTLAKTNKEIASALGISPATVKRHIENLLRKLQLRNRVEAAVYGVTVKGCPAQDRSACAFEMWRKKAEAG